MTVSNESGSEPLDIITATNWKKHRNLNAFFINIGYFIFNIFKGIFVPTRPWDEESWSSTTFHLVARDLRKHTAPNEPMWLKPVKLIRKIRYAITDVFKGVRDFSDQLVIKTPHNLRDDWDACDEVDSLSVVLKDAESTITAIKNEEQSRLNKSLELCGFDDLKQGLSPITSTLATVEYHLTAGEQNDILTAMARGLNEFGSVFSHNLFAKDPVAGLLFSSAFAIGAGAIYMPAATASIFGTAYVNWFSNFAYSVGSSKFAATLSAGSSQAQFLATGWDGLMHGANSIAVNSFYQAGEDPLTLGAYFAAATGIGYILVNGVAGHPIPWLSALLKEDLGTSPASSYPFIGAKASIMLYEILTTHKHQPEHYPELIAEFEKKTQKTPVFDPEQQLIIERFALVSWLSIHAETIPKIKPEQLFDLSRHIERLFNKDQSESLKKIINPEIHRSIAFQLFSIPLTYIPAVLRLLVSPILSLFAHISGKKYPIEPMRREATYVFEKCKKDLSRLFVFASHLVSLTHLLSTTFLRALIYTITMLIGRIAGYFDQKPSHAIHKVLGSIHTFFRTIGEFLYPAKALKSVTIANPVHTIKEVEGSYKTLLSQIDKTASKTDSDITLDSKPVFSNFSFEPKRKSNSDKNIEHEVPAQPHSY